MRRQVLVNFRRMLLFYILQCCVIFFTSTDLDDFIHVVDEDLAVADMTGIERLLSGIYHFFHRDFADDHFHLDLRQQGCIHLNAAVAFTGALLELEGNAVRMVATNVHRLAINEGKLEESFDRKDTYIVPKRVLEELQHITSSEIPEAVTVRCTRSEMSFETEKVYLTSRLIEGQFPDYRRAIPPEFSTRVTLKTADFLAAVSRVGLIARSSEYNTVKLIFNMGEVHISSDNPIVGKAEETVPAVIDGEDIKIAFNASYLLDVLKIVNGEEFVLSLNDSLKPAALRDPEKEDFVYILTPVRTKP